MQSSGNGSHPQKLLLLSEGHAVTPLNGLPSSHACEAIQNAVFLLAAAYTTVPQTVKATIQYNGIRGPFQGLLTTIVRNVPANSVYLGSFEVLKKRAAASYGCTQQELANDHPFTVSYPQSTSSSIIMMPSCSMAKPIMALLCCTANHSQELVRLHGPRSSCIGQHANRCIQDAVGRAVKQCRFLS